MYVFVPELDQGATIAMLVDVSVAWGITRHLVCAVDGLKGFNDVCSQVCREQGVPVQLQPPQLADIDSWQGAFISSTSRLLLPACIVQYQGPGQEQKQKVSNTDGVLCC